MAVSRRIRLGGSLCTLSPTEGKDRVKDRGLRALARKVVSVPERARDQSEQAFSAFGYVPGGLRLFSLGRMIAITDNAHV
jgi:hypothetical protein